MCFTNRFVIHFDEIDTWRQCWNIQVYNLSIQSCLGLQSFTRNISYFYLYIFSKVVAFQVQYVVNRIGIDSKIRINIIFNGKRWARKLDYKNVEFLYGDVENIPLAGGIADVVVSNCVLNLVPDKQQAFTETFRILKKGGHFSVSDIVLVGDLPEALQKSAEMYVGCVSGAIQKEQYLSIIEKAGFNNIHIQKEKRISLPVEILSQYLSTDQIIEFNNGKRGIYSITVYGEKP